MSKKCDFCNEKMGIKNFNSHLTECVLGCCLNKSGYLIEFTSHSPITNKIYKIFAVFGLDCKFSDIDIFLRNIWYNGNQYEASFQTYVENKMPKIIQVSDLVNLDDLEFMEKLHEYHMMSMNDSMEQIHIGMEDKITKRTKTKKFIVVTGAKKESKFQFEYNFIVGDEIDNNSVYFSIVKKLNGGE